MNVKVRLMFKQYDAAIKEILSTKSAGTNWPDILSRHQLMLARIQHERLIHLIVTSLVGMVMTIFICTAILTQSLILLAVACPLLLLFISYLFHYRFLENTAQSWYQLEDEIKKNQST